jgi:hypothetical protein
MGIEAFFDVVLMPDVGVDGVGKLLARHLPTGA